MPIAGLKHAPTNLSTFMQARSVRPTTNPPIASDFEGHVFLPLTTRMTITKKNVRINCERKTWKWNELSISHPSAPGLYGHNNGIRPE